jgi:uncharacterized membrane protein
VARESTPRLKLGDFGTFVIFAAIYAAGTLGLPKIALLGFQVKIGELPTAFVAIFGMPAVFGLTLGQFIANLGVEATPLASLTPAFSFVGLLAVYYMRKFNTLAGCLVYIVITTFGLTLLSPMVSGVPESAAAYSAFASQFVSVMIGYLVYLAARRSAAKPASPKSE